MATAPLYRAKKAGRTCPDCHRPIDAYRRYCDRDKHRRRAITFLRQALVQVDAIDAPAARVAGVRIGDALEELGG